MQREVLWTAEALADLIDIARHIARDNPKAAERVAAWIFDAAVSIGAGTPGRKGRVDGTYEKVVHRLPYILAYEIGSDDDGQSQVAILHVIHGARHWPRDDWPVD